MSDPIIEVHHPKLPDAERRVQIITTLQNAELALRMSEAALTDAVQWAVDIGIVPTAAIWDARQSQLRHSCHMLAITASDVCNFLSDQAIAESAQHQAREAANGVPV